MLRVFPHKAEEGSREGKRGGYVAREITIKTFGHCGGIRVENDKRSESRRGRVKRTNYYPGDSVEGKRERKQKTRGIRED